MTAKRFIYDGLHIRDLHDKIPPILTSNDKIRDKFLNELNELHEEIQECRDYNTKIYSDVAQNEIILSRENKQLTNENEHLKSRVDYLERKIQRERNSTYKQYSKWEKEAENKIKELVEENGQLKQQLELYQELYPSGKWICDLNSDELEKELRVE